MSDQPEPELIESESEDAVPDVRSDTSWDAVMERVPDSTEKNVASRGATSLIPPAWRPWIRAAVPLLIVLVYVGFKIVGGDRERGDNTPEVAESVALSGVKPPSEDLSLDRRTEEFVSKLEALQMSGNWDRVQRETRNADEFLKVHPTVKAFDVVSRVLTGGHATLDEIRALRQTLSRDRKQRALVDYLKLAEAELRFRASVSTDMALRNLDEFRELIGTQETMTRDVLAFRVKLAERFERLADNEAEGAGATFRTDRARLSTARNLYQQALKWVTTPEGWQRVIPVSEGKASVLTDRLVLKLHETNERFHGPVMPFTDRDNSTWTGQKNDPVHDTPGGRW